MRRRHYTLTMVVRDIISSWTQFVAVLCMACLSVAAYTGLEGAWNGLRVNLNQFADDSNMADLWVVATAITPQQITQIEEMPHVDQVQVRHEAAAQYEDPNGTVVWLSLVILEGQDSGIVSIPEVVSGAEITDEITDTEQGVWLDKRLASTHDLFVGDDISLVSRSQKGPHSESIPIRGTVISPDRVYNIRPADLTMPDSTIYGYGFITYESAASLFGSRVPLSTTILITTDAAVADVDAEVRTLLGSSVITSYDREANPTVSMAFTRVGTLRNLSILFSSLFVLVAVLAMYTSIKRLVDAQAKQIGTMRALGFTKGELIRHFSAFGLAAGTVGSALGLALAPVLSTTVLSSQKPQLDMPTWSVSYTPLPLVVVAVVIASCVTGAVLAARSCADGTPADLLRPGVPMTSRGTTGPINRIIHWFSYPMRWAFRDALANPVRMFMGVAGVVGSLMLLFAGLGLPNTIEGEARDNYSAQEAPYFARVDFLPGATPRQLATLDLGDSPQFLMQMSVLTQPSDGSNTTLTVVGEGDRFPLWTTDGLAIPTAKRGFWVAEGTATRLPLGAGDTATLLLPVGRGIIKMPVTDITDRSAPQGFFISHITWEALGFTTIPTAALVGEGTDLDALRSSPLVTFVVTRDAQYANALTLVESLTGIFMVLRVFALVLTVVVLYSLGSLTFDERKRQYATLKVLGLSTGELRRLSVIDNASVTLVGMAIGIPAGLWFLWVYVQQFNTGNVVFYSTRISASSVAIALGLTIAISSLTTLLLGRRIGAVDVVEALKGVE